MSKVVRKEFLKNFEIRDGKAMQTKRIAYRCPKCNKAVVKYYNFCPYCGEPLEFEGELKDE